MYIYTSINAPHPFPHIDSCNAYIPRPYPCKSAKDRRRGGWDGRGRGVVPFHFMLKEKRDLVEDAGGNFATKNMMNMQKANKKNIIAYKILVSQQSKTWRKLRAPISTALLCSLSIPKIEQASLSTYMTREYTYMHVS